MAARAHRLFVEVIEAEFTLEGERAHYLRDVLRLAVGHEIVVFDGAVEYAARIAAIGKRTCSIELSEALRQARPRPRLHLCHAAIKARLDAVAQTATELGITDFWVFAAERSNVRAALRGDRLERIVRSAAEQCQRVSVPSLHSVESLAGLLTSLAPARIFFGDTNEAEAGFGAASPSDEIAIIIGPEGGWTAAETGALIAAGAQPVYLGPQVLRATTAGNAALAAINATRGWPTDAEFAPGANG